ncbi:Protein of unknown function [Bacillus thuringiensis]|uniref:Uncharacterized protein n=1 Tax=Bacillus thuringiensis TaxID=1428 RepID=A0A1C4EEH1_BACTU|nr:Protein of unknown function [Bacillus thuringiensis]
MNLNIKEASEILERTLQTF